MLAVRVAVATCFVNGPCFVNELLLPCVYARFGVVAVRAVAAGAVAARRGGSSASSTKKESGGGGGHRLPAIGRERTATSVSRHSAARGRAAKGERHSVSPRGHRSRTQVVPVHTWQRAQPRRAARRTHALGAQPLVVARARNLSQRFEARLPFRMQSRMQSRMQGRAPSHSASKHGSHFACNHACNHACKGAHPLAARRSTAPISKPPALRR